MKVRICSNSHCRKRKRYAEILEALQENFEYVKATSCLGVCKKRVAIQVGKKLLTVKNAAEVVEIAKSLTKKQPLNRGKS